MKIDITYGDGKVSIDIPKKNLASVIVPKQVKPITNMQEELNRVLDNPHGSTLEELSKSKSVCVLVEDHTRDEPHWDLLLAVIPRLIDANRVMFVITTGSHEVNHPGNLEIVEFIHEIARESKLGDYEVHINDCQDTDVIEFGKTKRGTPVIITSKAANHDLYITISDMKAHYFAGYSNALKSFLPGVCAFASIEANHSMALNPNSTFGLHPYHPAPDRRGNPLADDMREAMEMITKGAKVFTLSVVTNSKKLVWADAGQLRPVIEGGIEFLDEIASFTVSPADRIIVSPGGYPQDKSLYHAQRALELTKNAVKDNGEILFIAECRDGIAPESAIENFYSKLKGPINQVTKSISEKYHLYEHKAYKFAELMMRISKIRMYTELSEKTVKDVHMEKAENIQRVVDDWIAQNPDVQILVLDKGNKLAIYAS